MKGIILAGGTGSRLRPLTYTMPKQMIPIANKPVMAYAIEKMVAAGIEEIGIVLGEHGADEIKLYFGDGHEFGADITYIYQGEPLGLGHAVGCTEEFIGGDSFVLILGDDMVQQEISPFVDHFDPSTYEGSIAVQTVDDPSRYGVVDTDETGDVVEVIEKPNEPSTNLAGIGIFVLTPVIFDAIREIEPSHRGELELSDAIQELLRDGERFQSFEFDGWWRDVGTPADVLDANRLVLEDFAPEQRGIIENDHDVTGRVSLGEGATIEAGATVTGPVSIGPYTTIESDSTIGPYTTIGSNCNINNCRIEESVILSDSVITCRTTLCETLLGRNVSITDAGSEGKKLLLGTDASAQL